MAIGVALVGRMALPIQGLAYGATEGLEAGALGVVMGTEVGGRSASRGGKGCLEQR